LIATIDGSGVLAIVVTAIATLAVAVLLGAALSLRRSARDLQALADELADHASMVITDAEATVARARRELDRVDDLVGSAEAISETVESATRLAHTALTTPLIKVMALGAGTARVGRKLRKAG
jgi:methyl-accepting chemotaxis protein